MSPSEKIVLLTPAFNKINRIEQKVKKKNYDAIILFYGKIHIWRHRNTTISASSTALAFVLWSVSGWLNVQKKPFNAKI